MQANIYKFPDMSTSAPCVVMDVWVMSCKWCLNAQPLMMSASKRSFLFSGAIKQFVWQRDSVSVIRFVKKVCICMMCLIDCLVNFCHLQDKFHTGTGQVLPLYVLACQLPSRRFELKHVKRWLPQIHMISKSFSCTVMIMVSRCGSGSHCDLR